MYHRKGNRWYDADGNPVSASEVENYLKRKASSDTRWRWSWFSFIVGLTMGVFGLSILSFVLRVIGWSFSRVGVVLEGLLALVIILIFLGAIAWLVLLLKSKWMNLNKQPGKSSGDQKRPSIKDRLEGNRTKEVTQ